MELLVCIIVITSLAVLLLPAVQKARDSARRVQCTNNLFQLGMALHNYHDVHRVFPPGYVSVVGPQGQDLGPGWGWAAMLLPYFDQKLIYDRIQFEVPLIHAANQQVASRRLDLLICPADLTACSYVASFGQKSMATNPDTGDGVFFRNSRIRLRDIEDGPMTLLLGERSSLMGGANWATVNSVSYFELASTEGRSAERNAEIVRAAVLGHTGQAGGNDPIHTPNVPAPCGAGFGSVHAGGANFLMVDGSVRFLNSNIDSALYGALATRAGAELNDTTGF